MFTPQATGDCNVDVNAAYLSGANLWRAIRMAPYVDYIVMFYVTNILMINRYCCFYLVFCGFYLN